MKLQIQFLIYGGASIDLSKDVLPNSKGQRSRFMYSEEGHLLFHLQAEHSLGQSITQVRITSSLTIDDVRCSIRMIKPMSVDLSSFLGDCLGIPYIYLPVSHTNPP